MTCWIKRNVKRRCRMRQIWGRSSVVFTNSGAATSICSLFFFFQAEDGIRVWSVTGVQTCALPISDAEVRRLRAAGGSDPMIETLAARVKQALGEPAAAAALLAEARARYPYSNPVLYAYAAALQDTGRNAEALALLAEPLRLHPRDYRLFALQSKTYAALGKRLLQHQAQAEFYALQGSLPAAIEQLQLARSAGDGDFYQLSVVDARLKDLRAQYSLEMRDAKR